MNKRTQLTEEQMYEKIVQILSDWYDEEKGDMGDFARNVIEFLRSYELG